MRYICQAADQLSTLIDDLLDLRKVEAGKIQLRVEKFTATDLFAALRGMFKPLATNDNVALVIDEPDDLPELHTDQGKVSQILRNLVSNALKFTVRGSVRVSCRLSQDGQLILFEVADTGIGIAPENHRRIFDEFSQVENPLQTTVKGTGLGLPLSQRLAGLLGGSIEIRSALGHGSTFTLAIPVRADGERDVDALASIEPATPMALDRVLIIDDNEIERYALRQFLSTSRYEVIEATGGYDGLRLARQAQPDVIFLDLMMPDIHGFEVLKMLKAIEDTRRIPVVLFTSQRLESDERAGGGGRRAADEERPVARHRDRHHAPRLRADGDRPCQKRLRRSSTSTTTSRRATRPRASCIAPASRCSKRARAAKRCRSCAKTCRRWSSWTSTSPTSAAWKSAGG